MKKLSIKNIVEFRGKSDKSKKKFATSLLLEKEKTDVEGGGDYWVSCISAISNSYKLNDLQSIIDKRNELKEKYEQTEYRRTKIMYNRNIDILSNYQDYDLNQLRPLGKVNFLKKHKDDSILNINGFQIQVTPQHVFTFQKDGIQEIGAIWFIAKLGGFRKEELGMFADILFRYLKTHFSKEYSLNSKYCIAVDVNNKYEISYERLEKREVAVILSSTLDEIKRLM